MTALVKVRKVGTVLSSSVFVYASSVPTGDPQTTKIGLSVVLAASTRSSHSLLPIEGSAPVIGHRSRSTLGSASIVSMIFGPRQSRTGAPPLSTGFETRR